MTPNVPKSLRGGAIEVPCSSNGLVALCHNVPKPHRATLKPTSFSVNNVLINFIGIISLEIMEEHKFFSYVFIWSYFILILYVGIICLFFLAGHLKLDNRVVFRTMHTLVIVGMLGVAFVLLNTEHAVFLQGTDRYTFIHTYIYAYINKYIHTFKLNAISFQRMELSWKKLSSSQCTKM